MGTFKDQFREFQSLGPVFMAGDIPVSVDYTEFNEKTEGAAETTLPQENALTSNDFKAKREKIAGVISKVQLDENVQAESDPEKEAKAAIKAHMEKAFSLIEHNYETRLQLVGRGPENTKAMEARNLLNQAADDFIFKMEMFAIQQNIQGFKVEEGGAMVERGSTEQGKLLAKCALIDNFTKVPGFGKYLVESNPNILDQLFQEPVAKNSQEFQEKLKGVLDVEGSLEAAIQKMIEKTPKFQEANAQEKAEIDRLVLESQNLAKEQKKPELSLTYMLGTENEQTLKDTLARRFRINFVEGTNNVDTYVDLMDGNRLYKPGTEFNKKLLSICNTDLGSPRKLEGHQKLIATREEAQADLHGELLSGKFWSSDMEVTGLSTLKNNPKLNQLIASAQKYENAASVEGRQINDALAQLTGMSTAPDGVSQETRAMVDALRGGGETGTNYVKSHPALRDGGLKFVVALIQAMMGNPKALDEIYKGVNDKENLAETTKGFNDLLEKKQPKPQEALAWHGATLPVALTEGLEPKMKEQLAKYPELRAEAVRAYIGNKLGAKVTAISAEGLVTLKKGDNEFKVKLEMSGQTFIAKQIIGEGAGKPIDASKWDTVKAFVAQLSLTAAPVAQTVAPVEAPVEADPIKATHKATLEGMVRDENQLKDLVKAMTSAYPGLKGAPVYKEFRVKKGQDKQRLVNEARVAWILKDENYPKFKELVGKDQQDGALANLLKPFKPAPAGQERPVEPPAEPTRGVEAAEADPIKAAHKATLEGMVRDENQLKDLVKAMTSAYPGLKGAPVYKEFRVKKGQDKQKLVNEARVAWILKDENYPKFKELVGKDQQDATLANLLKPFKPAPAAPDRPQEPLAGQVDAGPVRPPDAPPPPAENAQDTTEKTPDQIMTEIFERLGSRIEVTVEKTSSLSGNALRIKSLEDVLKKVFETITSNLPQRISSTISSTDIARLGLTLPYVKDPPRSADPNSITASFTLEDENTAHKTNKQLIEDFIRAKLAPAVAAR